MWLRVTLTLVALRAVEPLREIRPFNIHPSLISNIHLLVPLKVAEQQDPNYRAQPNVKLRISDSWEHSKETGQHTDNEAYSNIPGYAFTLDTDSILTDKGTVPKPEVDVKPSRFGHSLYLDQEWNNSQNELHGRHRIDLKKEEHNEKQSVKVENTTEARLRECRMLGRHHSPEARELLVQLCTDLVELLASRCKCCDEPAAKPQKVAINNVMPWFGSFNSRREPPQGNDDIDHIRKPRVFA